LHFFIPRYYHKESPQQINLFQTVVFHIRLLRTSQQKYKMDYCMCKDDQKEVDVILICGKAIDLDCIYFRFFCFILDLPIVM